LRRRFLTHYRRRAFRLSARRPGLAALPLVAQLFGNDTVIWASDYPHERDQRDFSQDIPTLIQREDISDALKRQIFFDNALGFYPRLRERLDKTASLARAAAG